MKQYPFSPYDFFGYLISGALILVALESLFGSHWLNSGDLTAPQFTFWLLVSYALGHVLATPAQILLEKLITRKGLDHPTAILLGLRKSNIAKFFFPGYFQRLPESTIKSIFSLIPEGIDKNDPEAMFYEAFSFSRLKPESSARMNTFLNLYGFSRNLSFASLSVLLMMIAAEALRAKDIATWLYIAIGFASISFFYRFLKFYRLYAHECLIGLLLRRSEDD